MTKTIVYQGEQGANSHIACKLFDPELEPIACPTFDQAFNQIIESNSDLGMIPIENSIAGRVADIHRLMPTSGLKIIGEFFLEIQHTLMGIKESDLNSLKVVRSHEMALSQCRYSIEKLNLTPQVAADTAGSAREVSELSDRTIGAIASPLAAEIYNLKILKENMEDKGFNTTRFLILSKDEIRPDVNDKNSITTLVFKVRNVPSALYKALGGFATNGVNMLKLESYQIDGSFLATQFYVDIKGHCDEASVKRALDELSHYAEEIKILGVYQASRER
ncbi:prephenate dehydratase [bacterium]|nr:prephenate dehydratase [bacterium]